MNKSGSGLGMHIRDWPLVVRFWLVLLVCVFLAGGTAFAFSARNTTATLRAGIQDKYSMAAMSNLASSTGALVADFTVLRSVAADQAVVDVCLSSKDTQPGDSLDTLSELQQAWALADDDSPMVRSVVDPEVNDATAQLRRHLSDSPEFVEVLVVDGAGVVVAATRPPAVLYQAALPWWQSAYAEGKGSQYAGIYQVSGDPDRYRHVEIAVPIHRNSPNGSDLIGMVYARIRISDLLGNLTGVGLSNAAGVLVVDARGRTIAATEEDLVGSSVDSTWRWREQPPKAERQAGEVELPDGTSVLVGYASMHDYPFRRTDDAGALKDLGWQFFVYESLGSAYAGVRRALVASFTASLGVSLALLGGSWLMVRAMLSPLQHLVAFAAQLGTEESATRVWLYPHAEAGPLSNAFNLLLDERDSLKTELAVRDEDNARDRARRQDEVELLSAIGDLVASATDVAALTNRTVEIIEAQYNLYYTSLYLTDDARRWAVLKAGTGEPGRLSLARGHRVSMGSGFVGTCLQSGSVQVVKEPDDASAQIDMVLLPYARSSVAVPLRSRGVVVGVLAVYSYQADTFSSMFIETLQIVADQLAVAIDSIHLSSERAEAEARLRRAYGALTSEAWLEMLGDRVGRGYEATLTDTHSLPSEVPEAWQDALHEAWSTGQIASADVVEQGDVYLHQIALPIRTRDQVMGVLEVSKLADRGDLTADELTVLRELAVQLGLALENARLYEMARRSAVEERMVGEATQRMRETLSVDSVLQTAVRELLDLLNLEDVEIRVGTADDAAIARERASTNGGDGDCAVGTP